MSYKIPLLLGCVLGAFAPLVLADNGRLIATGGATSIEGSAGGGITPWAVITGYSEQGEWGATAFATHVNLPDYNLDVAGLAFAYGNRLELSYAHQRFDISPLQHRLSLPDDNLSQDVFGVKLRLFGDLIYDSLPQVSLGVQYKHQNDFLIPSLVGAQRDSDVEGYLTASRLFMGAAFGYNVVVNGGVRYSRANETGLLGFGGDRRGRPRLLKKGAVCPPPPPKQRWRGFCGGGPARPPQRAQRGIGSGPVQPALGAWCRVSREAGQPFVRGRKRLGGPVRRVFPQQAPVRGAGLRASG
ncbi:Uncharacterized protein AC507_2088 [Pseudomonas syringae pv. maculicola]|nr:Uncharacterized protein AC507_2088 [Pseudomonas syringae pv. maculicola]